MAFWVLHRSQVHWFAIIRKRTGESDNITKQCLLINIIKVKKKIQVIQKEGVSLHTEWASITIDDLCKPSAAIQAAAVDIWRDSTAAAVVPCGHRRIKDVRLKKSVYLTNCGLQTRGARTGGDKRLALLSVVSQQLCGVVTAHHHSQQHTLSLGARPTAMSTSVTRDTDIKKKHVHFASMEEDTLFDKRKDTGREMKNALKGAKRKTTQNSDDRVEVVGGGRGGQGAAGRWMVTLALCASCLGLVNS